MWNIGAVIRSIIGLILLLTPLFSIAVDKQKPYVNRFQLPILFEQNIGQTNKKVNYLVRQPQYVMFLTADEFVTVVGRGEINPVTGKSLKVKSDVFSMSLVGAQQTSPIGKDQSKAHSNHYIGNDKNKWVQKIPVYNQVVYKDAYKGIDMIWGNANQRLNYQFNVSADSSLEQIQIAYKGIKDLSINNKGQLILTLYNGAVVYSTPRFYETHDGQKKRVEGKFIKIKKNVIGFKVAKRTTGKALLIDPEVDITSFFVERRSPGLQDLVNNPEAFIRLSFDIDSRTDINIADIDFNLIALNSENHFFVSGTVMNADFPEQVPDEFIGRTELLGRSDAFVMGFTAPLETTYPELSSGPVLRYATYIGGDGIETNAAVAATDGEAVYIAGHTESGNFPTPGLTFRSSSETTGGSYIARLNSSGVQTLGTMIGTSPRYFINDIVFDRDSVYVAGVADDVSGDTNDATDDAVQEEPLAHLEGFIAKLDQGLFNLHYFTHLGGNSNDAILGLDVRDGLIFVTGFTASPDFHVKGLNAQGFAYTGNQIDCRATDPNHINCLDGFVALLNLNQDNENDSELVFSTLFDAVRETEDDIEDSSQFNDFAIDYSRSIAVNQENGKAYITGGSQIKATGEEVQDLNQVFVAELQSGGEFERDNHVILNTKEGDHGQAITLDPFIGTIHVTGTIGDDEHEHAAVNITDLEYLQLDQLKGEQDIFYMLRDPRSDAYIFSYLGGPGSDQGMAVATFTNCAMIMGEQNINLSDPIPSLENPDMAMYRVCISPPKITIKKTVSETERRPGDEFEYEIRIENESDQTVTGTLTDELPRIISDQEADPGLLTIINVTPSNCSRDSTSSIVTCEDMEIPPGVTVVTIEGQVPDDPCQSQELANVARFEYEVLGETITIESEPASFNLDCPSVCGNGIREGREECDDGNLLTCDGCSINCLEEDPPLGVGNICSGNQCCESQLICAFRPVRPYGDGVEPVLEPLTGDPDALLPSDPECLDPVQYHDLSVAVRLISVNENFDLLGITQKFYPKLFFNDVAYSVSYQGFLSEPPPISSLETNRVYVGTTTFLIGIELWEYDLLWFDDQLIIAPLNSGSPARVSLEVDPSACTFTLGEQTASCGEELVSSGLHAEIGISIELSPFQFE